MAVNNSEARKDSYVEEEMQFPQNVEMLVEEIPVFPTNTVSVRS